MLTNRRDILSLLAMVGGSAIGRSGATNLSHEPWGFLESEPQTGAADQSTFDFWTQDIRNPETNGRTRSLGAAPRAAFVYYDERNGFLASSDIQDDGLPDTGDLDVIVNVDHIRASTADQKRFANLEAGSLRIDVQQSAPLRSLSERLAWTAIAGFLPENKKLPDLKEMTFNPGSNWGQLQTVPLPEGGGRWTWNFFLQEKKGSRWMQLLDMIRRNKGLLMPIFGVGLPAIAITALKTVDSMVGQITKDARTEWLFQSADVYFYGTKRARDVIEGSKLRLRKGMYVIIPSDKLADFGKVQHTLAVKDGLIVPKNTSAFDVEAAARSTIADITYLTVGVTTRYRPAAR